MSVIIIAEAGVNHNGNIKLAKEMVNKAKEAGADYIKFQTFKPKLLVSRYASKAEYQKKTTDESQTQLQMLEKMTLNYEDFVELKSYCEHIGIGFISTPFDLESIDFLESLNMDFWKIPSGEVTNLPYLESIGKTGRKVILSTGMCEIEEIYEALNILEKSGSGDITILHCNTDYPTDYNDVNLLAMHHIAKEFNKPIGYSDHTIGIEIPIAAVALGATVIEKHFTLDKNMDGPDHKASLNPIELKDMITSIRNTEKGLGDGIKKRTMSEQRNCIAARKSIVAKTNIEKGETFTIDNITIKRPGNGISAMLWYEVLGKVASHEYKEDELISEEL